MKRRQKQLTHKEVSRRGGLARAKKLDPEKRRQIASYGGRIAASNRKQRKSNGKKSGK